MTYRQITVRSADRQTEHQWVGRTLAQDVALAERRNLGDLVLRHLPKDGPVLEAGCGIGGWVRWLQDHGYDVVGVDWYPQVVQAARLSDPSLKIEVGDVNRLRWPDGHFSAYVSLGVLEHWEEGPAAPLREAFRVLRPGGIAIITVPGETLTRRLVAHPLRSMTIVAIRVLGRRPVYFGEYRYSWSDLRGYVEAAGFELLYTDIDDVRPAETDYHLGLWADYPFLRRTEFMRLNAAGRIVRRLTRPFHRHTAAAFFVAARKPARESAAYEGVDSVGPAG